MINLDRFSRSITGEGQHLSLDTLEWLRQQDKQDMVSSFIHTYADNYGLLPERDTVLEALEAIYIDNNLVEQELVKAKGMILFE